MKNKELVRKIFAVTEKVLSLLITAFVIYFLLIRNYEMATIALLVMVFGVVVNSHKHEAELIELLFDYMKVMMEMQLEDLRNQNKTLKNDTAKEKKNGKRINNSSK